MRNYWVLSIPVLWCSGAAAWQAAAGPASPLAPLVRAYRAHATPQTKAAVRAWASAHPKDGALANLALGVTAYEQKQYPEAIESLKPAQGKLPDLADYSAYYLAAAQVEAKDYPNVASEVAPIATAEPRSPFAGRAQIAEAKADQDAAPLEAARTLREHYSDLPQPDGDLAMGDAYQAARQLPQAVDFYRRVYAEHPTGEAGARAAAALLALKDAMGTSFPAVPPALMLRRGDRLIELRAYVLAREEFDGAQAKLTGVAHDQAVVRSSAAQYLAGGVGGAYTTLSALKLAASEADAERLYWMEECARRLSNSDGQKDALKRLEENYHRSPWRLKALVAAANALISANRSTDYVPLYKEAYEDFPADPAAGLSHWRVAFQSYLHDEAGATDLLRDQLQHYPTQTNAGSALYFLARSAERKGDFGLARAYYERLSLGLPNQYYALLARDHLRTEQIRAATAPADAVQWCAGLKLPAAKPVTAAPSRATAARIARARLLRQAGLWELADAELRFGAKTDGQPALIAIEIGAEAEAPHTGMHLMKAVTPDYLTLPMDQAPRQYWEYLFPMPFKQDIAANAAAHDLDIYLVAGLIRQESEFDPKAISPAHADGLMQLLPVYARPVAHKIGIAKFTNAMLFEPQINMKIGTTVLRTMLNQQHGNIEQTLAAYNAGPGRVTSWLTWFNYREPAEFIESIPITETREYVQGVLRNAEMYRKLYQ